MNTEAIAKAQEIVDNTVDIRPQLKGKVVTEVCRIQGSSLWVKVTFSDGSDIQYTGLFARLISDLLPVKSTFNNLP